MLFALHRATTEGQCGEIMGASSVTPVPSLESLPVGKPVILLVEDESVVREVTRQVLEHAGYEVVECAGPQEALRLAAAHRGRIGLLLSDVVMPEMNGLDLARRIQAIQPSLTTIFMSGYAESAVLQKAARNPRSTYIRKPFTVDLLLTRVATTLAGEPATSAELADLSA
jgi:two-component system, cell cycle sensor histidine kinase and response regulator CckA